MEYYSAIKKNEIIPFAATWMDPRDYHTKQIIKRKTNTIDFTYTWNLEYNTNELIYKTETDSQTQRIDLWLPRRKGVAEGWSGSLGLGDANSYIEWVNNKVLLYSTGNYTQYTVINHNGKEYKKEHIYIYV